MASMKGSVILKALSRSVLDQAGCEPKFCFVEAFGLGLRLKLWLINEGIDDHPNLRQMVSPRKAELLFVFDMLGQF